MAWRAPSPQRGPRGPSMQLRVRAACDISRRSQRPRRRSRRRLFAPRGIRCRLLRRRCHRRVRQHTVLRRMVTRKLTCHPLSTRCELPIPRRACRRRKRRHRLLAGSMPRPHRRRRPRGASSGSARQLSGWRRLEWTMRPPPSRQVHRQALPMHPPPFRQARLRAYRMHHRPGRHGPAPISHGGRASRPLSPAWTLEPWRWLTGRTRRMRPEP